MKERNINSDHINSDMNSDHKNCDTNSNHINSDINSDHIIHINYNPYDDIDSDHIMKERKHIEKATI